MSVRDTSHPIGRGGDDRRGQQRIEEVRVGEQGHEILQRRMPRAVGEGIDRQPRQRQHDQRDQYARKQPQHRPGPVDARFWRDAGGDGHA
jgi:hypothetical protein